jgi:hypothetical protein
VRQPLIGSPLRLLDGNETPAHAAIIPLRFENLLERSIAMYANLSEDLANLRQFFSQRQYTQHMLSAVSGAVGSRRHAPRATTHFFKINTKVHSKKYGFPPPIFFLPSYFCARSVLLHFEHCQKPVTVF